MNDKMKEDQQEQPVEEQVDLVSGGANCPEPKTISKVTSCSVDFFNNIVQ